MIKFNEDFSVVVKYDEIAQNNYTLIAGQYFEVKIEYADITQEEFDSKINGFETYLNQLFAKGKELVAEIQTNLKALNYE